MTRQRSRRLRPRSRGCQSPGCQSRDEFRLALSDGVLRVMDENRLDALVYPTWSNPPRLIGDLNTPGGDNNQLFAPSTGFPAMTFSTIMLPERMT